ncbi:MAG: LUD domain-containing protein [Chloroflexi bacterium]|nr:LUD domain-containing protein [Chloroflexota bacterium]
MSAAYAPFDPSTSSGHSSGHRRLRTRPFKQRLRQALDSPNLEVALERALTRFRELRAASFAPGEFQERRRDLARRKTDFVQRLPELVERFKAEAEAVGAVVHLARDAQEACRIVGRLARERGVKLVVKSKSMATEEIGLNAYLEERGVRAVETDLGEWIIQLAGEHPSHLIAPAVHKTKEEVAELFSRVTQQEIPPDIEQLVQVARREMRQAFIEADMGVTGTNIAIAESGTLVLVTNEGNGRLVSALPPVHVAILGVEKIVPTLEDAAAVLRLLPRSATGQKLSVYTSFITGPSRTGDIELSMTTGVHGPKEVHIILLDNGRWAAREDPELWETLRCIRCGACSNVCPSYQAVGGHAFGYVYTGPIGLIFTAQHHGLENAAGPQSLCASCNACETVCPVEIPLPRLILEVRQRWVAQEGLPWAKRTALEAFAKPEAFQRWLAIGRFVQGPFKQADGFLRVPFTPGFRSLPALPELTLHQRMAGRRPEPAEGRQPAMADPRLAGSPVEAKRVALFGGCITNLLYPEMGEAVAAVLEALGAQVDYPQEQWCCGLALLNAGDRAGGLPLARQTIEVLERCGADYIVSGAASCVVAIQQDYPELFKHEPEWRARAEAVGKRLVDFTSFLERVAGLSKVVREPLMVSRVYPELVLSNVEGLAEGNHERSLGQNVTYHDACQSLNCLGLKEEGRRLLRAAGIEVAEMQDSGVCCGFGGSFSLDHPEVSERLLRRKLRNILATGAATVVADNPGCILHLRGGLDAQLRVLREAGEAVPDRVRVLHLAELLAEGLRG